MKPVVTATVLILSLGVTAMPALARGISEATKTQITEQLTAQGYDPRKIVSEDGMYEVYALKDGQKLELYLNDKFEIVDVKQK